MEHVAEELKAQLHEAHAAFGKLTIEANRLRDEIAERDRKIETIELQRHHDGIRIMGLIEDNAQLKNTIKQKIETVRMGNSDEETDEIEPFQDAVEPKIISGPHRVRIEKKEKDDGALRI